MRAEAWVLYRAGTDGRSPESPGELRLEEVELPELGPLDVLTEPLYGCWEANMTHALERKPIDIVAARGEQRVVLGNCGLLRVLRTGRDVTGLREGDVCFLVCGNVLDRWGYVKLVHGYDGPGSMGVLAKRTVVPARLLLPVPRGSRHSLVQWATYARYWTAWSNWRLAYGTWRLQVPGDETPYVVAWGGGVGLAQAELAQIKDGARAAVIASSPSRLALIASKGVHPIDRSTFPGLAYDAARFAEDPGYRRAYRASERRFLAEVRAFTGGHGASIVVDNIGGPVYRASLRALDREGVIATCGWKHGMATEYLRAVECIERHQHIHTHAAARWEVDDAVAFQEEHGWLPEVSSVTPWEDVARLSQAYADGKVDDYFPVFEVNPV
ncbi:hypothetical protein AQ490_12205 [Wenjunlia vitaminophila]|uniref:Zinc-binding dehydrogenase n=1 Tax=Wenjunlia vitaminophila TaxID=76728 RepID=A0A0T6LKJ9_WENVI|nr:zinc-binding dehydrogenase [Wenjunlia vitaminophila]KRV46627.1 hypothetical protein AQ490_12205 [Wenjunlia vitaminophila]